MNANSAKSLQVEATGKSLGADIHGVDFSQPLSEATVSAIIDAWHEHQVLRFRGQKLSNQKMVRFSRHFGELDLAPISSTGEREIPEHPELLVVSNVKVNGKPIGSLGSYESDWHTDMSYIEIPPKMTCLYSVEIPESGGDTSFLNMYEAYDTLPDELKEAVAGKKCKHDYSRNSAGELRKGYEQYADVTDPREIPGALHPIVYTHPITGRKALYLGRRVNAYIDGLSLDDSEALLDALWAHATQSRFRWDQVWKVGDLVLWDNRCTMHRRDAFDDSARRILHRTQVKGDERPA